MGKSRIAAILIMVLLAAGTTRGQCSVAFAPSGFTENDVFSGSAILPASLTIQGSGEGPVSLNGNPVNSGYNFARTSVSGDFTVIVRMSSLTGSPTTPYKENSGILTVSSGSSPTYVRLGVVRFPTGVFYMKIDYAKPLGGLYGWNNQYISPPITNPAATPLWLKLTRTGGIYTASTKTDTTGWTALASGYAPPMLDPTFVGISADSFAQTAGVFTRATFDNISVNAATPQLPDADFGNTGGNVGWGVPKTQGGTLTVGPNSTASGTTTLSIVGTCSQAERNSIQAHINSSQAFLRIQYDLQNGANHQLQTSFNGPLGCTSCLLGVTTSQPGSATLVHGTQYTLTTTVSYTLFDGSASWATYNPLVKIVALNP